MKCFQTRNIFGLEALDDGEDSHQPQFHLMENSEMYKYILSNKAGPCALRPTGCRHHVAVYTEFAAWVYRARHETKKA